MIDEACIPQDPAAPESSGIGYLWRAFTSVFEQQQHSRHELDEKLVIDKAELARITTAFFCICSQIDSKFKKLKHDT